MCHKFKMLKFEITCAIDTLKFLLKPKTFSNLIQIEGIKFTSHLFKYNTYAI